VRGRIGERTDHAMKIPERPWPPAGQNQRRGIVPLAADVDEVNEDAIDQGPKLRPSVDRSLPLAPVIRAQPMLAQLCQVAAAEAVAPIVVREIIDGAKALLIEKLSSDQAATLRAALPALERLYELDEGQRDPGSS
jgi:hypothetical protein